MWRPGLTLKQIEDDAIRDALQYYANRDTCAESLGISRRTLDTRIAEFKQQAQAEQNAPERVITEGLASIKPRVVEKKVEDRSPKHNHHNNNKGQNGHKNS